MSIGRENQRKIEYEENYMTRLPVTKQEKHRNKKISTMGQLGDELTSFGGSSSASSKKRKAPKGKGKKSMYFSLNILNYYWYYYLSTIFL